MKLRNIAACAVLAAATHLCAVDATSILVTFAPPEDPAAVDTYSDGTVVLDGERYALVWYPATSEAFGGISAAGLAQREGEYVLKIASLAKNGRIPAPCVIFPVSASLYEENNLANGHFALYLLDTRVATGTYDSSGAPVYALSTSAFDVNAAGAVVDKASAGEGGSGVSVNTVAPAKASFVAAAPGNVPQPEITGFELSGGYAYITMKKNANVVRVSGSDDLSRAFVSTPGETVADNGDGTVTVAVPANGEAGFFNVKGIQ